MNTDGDSDIKSFCLDLSLPHTCKHCMFPNTTLMSMNRYSNLSLPLHIMYIHKQIICTVPALGPSEPGKALMEVNELFLASPPPPRPVFISLRLFWSSGVISKTKCLSAHKGRWLICFNASICQASCLLLHSVWKESLASQLAFQDLQAFQHLRQERPTVRLRVCSHVNICLCTYVRV